VRGYECMLILPPDADEALVGGAVDRIRRVVEPVGGSIGQIDRWGRRRFAFEIDHQHEGYYVVFPFRAEPSAQPELERVLNIADEVIRHKITILPDVKPRESKQRSRNQASPAPA
jgi:small subunit ribosomal protein S6